MTANGHKAAAILEGDEQSPCDFYETAGIPINIFDGLPFDLHENGIPVIKTENYAYIRIDKCPEHIASELRRWDMGDEGNRLISVGEYLPCALERLGKWADDNANREEALIIDSGYLQNPINEMFFRGADDNETREYIRQIYAKLRLFSPVCVYLRRNSADEAIAFAKEAKGEVWASRVDALLNESGQSGMFERRFRLELELLPLTSHIICEVNGWDWDDAKRSIENFVLRELT